MCKRHALSAALLLGLSTAALAADRPWWQFWGGVAENAADAATASVVQDVAARTFTPNQERVLRDFLAQRPYGDYARDRRYRDDRYEDRDDSDHRRTRGDSGDSGDSGDKKYKKDKHKDKHKEKSLPPGLQKKLARGGELPPGWQKKMARGQVVDDVVWRESRHLPPDILQRLGPMPADTELRYVEDKVYRVMRNTREIIDILGQ